MKDKVSKGNKDSLYQNYLVDYGVISESSASTSASANLLLAIQPNLDSIKITKPSKYIDFIWKRS